MGQGSDGENNSPIVKTSDPEWFAEVLEHYKKRTRFILQDDAGIGVTPDSLRSGVALIGAMRSAGMSKREILQVLAGLGICGVGIWLVLIAVWDPEPTSKLAILLAGGVSLLATGSVAILRALGQSWHVTIRGNGPGGPKIEVRPS